MTLTPEERLAQAIEYLGKRHVLHTNYIKGTIAPHSNASAPDVGKYLRAHEKKVKQEAKLSRESADRILKYRRA